MLGAISDFLKKRRADERFNRRVQVLFRAERGVEFVGVSEDVNERALLCIAPAPALLLRGDTGILRATFQEESVECTGRVLRVVGPEGRVVLAYNQARAGEFFAPLIVRGTHCRNCGGDKFLKPCPVCKGFNTVCRPCLAQGYACMDCRMAALYYDSRQLVSEQAANRK
ncbi:MAG: hypothetical protein HQL90_06695 [Magnetococcales bacterium]|nr:hypothetical protein [Magnetococcales bacterium]